MLDRTMHVAGTQGTDASADVTWQGERRERNCDLDMK